MKDIQTREDLAHLLSEFYAIAVEDELIGHHFKDLDMESHIPVIVDFWDKVLFGNPVYFGNPLFVHHTIHEKSPLQTDHFKRWKTIFDETVDRLFSGETADLAKARAQVVASSLNMRLNEDVPSYTHITGSD